MPTHPSTPPPPAQQPELQHVTADDATSYMSHFENILAPGNEPRMTKPYKPKVATQFDKYLNPQTLKQHVLQSDKLHGILQYYARETQQSMASLERQARLIIDEIGLERNLPILRWCGVAITAIGKRILDGINVNATSIGVVRDGMGSVPVLYLPSHRSYMDFILMSYICFHYNIEIPGIAAGMDFHSMFGMGTMLRKTGAFFMRRSFSNDQLYWDIFREYMYALVASYHIGVEFFIEGTRSRNFKALVPKVGLLSMALLPYFTGEVSDITVVPVSISYERVLEEQLFVYELLGVPKPKESTKGFFKALKIIDERFGRMYVDFGAPISARAFFAHHGEQRVGRAALGAHLQKLNRDEIELVKKLANEVVYQQQRRIVMNTFNLLSLYFASELYMKRNVNIDEFARALVRLKGYFEELGAHVATDTNRIKPEIIDTVEIHANIVHFHNARLQFTQVAAAQLAQEIDTRRLKGHALSPHTMAVALPTLGLQLYINPCLFWLARPAYLVLAALQVQQEQSQQLDLHGGRDHLLSRLAACVAHLEEIFKHEFVIEPSRDAEEFRRNLDFLQAHGVLHISAGEQITVHANECSRMLLAALAPFLCLYYQLVVTLNGLGVGQSFSSKDVLVRMQQRVEEALQSATVTPHMHPYCLALDNLNIALYACVQAGYLQRERQSELLRHNAAGEGKSLAALEQHLQHYCQLMPFAQYYVQPAAEQATAPDVAGTATAAAAPTPWHVPAKL